MSNTTLSGSLLIIFLFLTGIETDLHGQNNRLLGRIQMPDHKSKSRITRGQAYRNRIKNRVSEEKRSIDERNLRNRNVIISLHPTNFSPTLRPTGEAYIRQKEKTFYPNVLPVTVGSTVYFINDDEFYHNVFSITPKAKFNIGRRPAGTKHGKRIDKVGEIKIFCDIHPQMRATILALNTPYFARVDQNGAYQIGSLPDGTYRVEIYHPSLPRHVETLKLSGGKTMDKDFNLSQGAVKSASYFLGPGPGEYVMCKQKTVLKNAE